LDAEVGAMINLLATVSGDSKVASAPAVSPTTAPAPDATNTAAAKPAAPAPPEPSHAEIKQASRQLETFMQSMNRYLEFRIDQESGRTVVTVKDKTTGDVVRQIPAEEVLRLAQNLGGKGGALLNRTA
jgi:flagellar protein FlaG